MSTTANNIAVPANYKNPHNGKRIRIGKTKRDALNGNAQRNAARKAARAEWQKDKHSTNATFPS